VASLVAPHHGTQAIALARAILEARDCDEAFSRFHRNRSPYAAFQLIRDAAQNPLAAAVNAYVMQDEARHVAFGRLALRDYYPKLTQAERDEREEFVIEACYLMRDRFLAEEVWQQLGLPVAECMAHTDTSSWMTEFRSLGFPDVDAEALQRDDERVA